MTFCALSSAKGMDIKMEEPKTLSYDWQYGREELFLRVDSYMSDDNLYIGLYHMEDGYPESFADLTVNLPFAPLGGINEPISTTISVKKSFVL